MHGVPLNSNKISKERGGDKDNDGKESRFVSVKSNDGLDEDGKGIDNWTDVFEVDSIGLYCLDGWGEVVFEFKCVIIEGGVEGFELSSEFSKPMISVILFVFFRLFGGLCSILRSLGVSSVLGEAEFGFHDEPEYRENDSEEELNGA